MISNNYFQNEVEPALAECKNAEQMLEVLYEAYDLSKPLGSITHLAFRQGLRTAIKMLNPEAKNV